MALPPLVEPVRKLSPAEAARTARHAALYPLGELGQRRLAAARVAIVGAGGLGSPAILALAAAGVGHLTVIDDDVVDPSNLQRQILHRRRDEGRAKVDSAVRAAADLAPECVVVAVRERLTPDNAERLLAGADVVLDGTDTFTSRVAVADACEGLGVPLVWGTVQEFTAQVTVFWSRPPAGVPSVRLADLHPRASALDVPSCAEVGVLGAVVLQVGSLMATQAILLLSGIGEPLIGRIALVDALRSTAREIPLLPAAGPAEPVTVEAALPATEPADPAPASVSLPEGALVVDVREQEEHTTGVIPGALLLPLAELVADERIRFDAPVVTVCASGVRSRHAAEILTSRGTDATSLPGGMSTWTGPVVVAA